MITIPVVEYCPHTKAGKGVLHITHDVLATLAGAVHDHQEWIALLVGTRSADGLSVTVNSLKVPLQERGSANCELAQLEPLTPDIVGVIHSHHSLGAFFSKTDHDELNPRFPLSLVIAQLKTNSPYAEQLLGFEYEAEGRTPLPCNSIGVIDFTVIPTPAIPEWPVTVTPEFGEPDLKASLYQCPHSTRTRVGLTTTCKTTCGIEVTEPTSTIFGRTGKEFMDEVKVKTQRPTYKGVYYGGYNRQGNRDATVPLQVTDTRKNKHNKGNKRNDGPVIGQYYNPFPDGDDHWRPWGF